MTAVLEAAVTAVITVGWFLLWAALWSAVITGALVVGGFRKAPRLRRRVARHPDPAIILADAALALREAGADEQWVKDYVIFDVIGKEPRALEWAKVRRQRARFK